MLPVMPPFASLQDHSLIGLCQISIASSFWGGVRVSFRAAAGVADAPTG
jgi:hypothetical protein